MLPDNGVNPMRWDCGKQGCFNIKKRPKIEFLADCLPGRIAFTDVDGLVELKGNLLFLEWKEHGGLGIGQRILFKQLTRFCPATVLVIEGNAEDMTVNSIRIVWNGKIGPQETRDFNDLRIMVSQWASWAKSNPVTGKLEEVVCE